MWFTLGRCACAGHPRRGGRESEDMNAASTLTERFISNDLVDGYAVWLSQHVDLIHDAPAKDGAPSHRHDLVGVRQLIRAHMEQRSQLQYRCWPHRPVQVVMLGFHSTGDRCDDVLEQSDHMMGYFPGAYREVSPCHSGFNAYLLVDRGPSRRAFAELLAAFGEALSAIADDYNFKATVKVHGLDSPAEAPWLPRRDQDLSRLLSSPVLGVDELRRVVEDAPEEAWLAEGQDLRARLAA